MAKRSRRAVPLRYKRISVSLKPISGKAPSPSKGEDYTMLELKDVHTYYGNIHALKGISLNVEKGEIVTLIGSNGAGKSTTLRTISGILQPRQGELWLEGQRLDRVPAHKVVQRGVLQSPE